jgi:hypothetical protein
VSFRRPTSGPGRQLGRRANGDQWSCPIHQGDLGHRESTELEDQARHPKHLGRLDSCEYSAIGSL